MNPPCFHRELRARLLQGFAESEATLMAMTGVRMVVTGRNRLLITGMTAF